MSRSYEYDVTLSTGPGDTFTETIEQVAMFVDTGNWTVFHNADNEVVARFQNTFVVGVVRGDEADPNPTQDSAS